MMGAGIDDPKIGGMNQFSYLPFAGRLQRKEKEIIKFSTMHFSHSLFNILANQTYRW